MRRIGIYAGSFDPVHDGHIAFAKGALNVCQLDKIFFLVEPRPRHKQGVKAFEHRNAMLELAIKDEKRFGNIIIEQSRFSVPDTLPVLKARFRGSQLFMLLGDDVFAHLASWPHSEDLAQAIHFIVAVRQISLTATATRLQSIQEAKGLVFSTTIIQATYREYSSGAIRLQLKRGNAAQGLDPAVVSYIKTHKLYASASNATS